MNEPDYLFKDFGLLIVFVIEVTVIVTLAYGLSTWRLP